MHIACVISRHLFRHFSHYACRSEYRIPSIRFRLLIFTTASTLSVVLNVYSLASKCERTFYLIRNRTCMRTCVPTVSHLYVYSKRSYPILRRVSGLWPLCERPPYTAPCDFISGDVHPHHRSHPFPLEHFSSFIEVLSPTPYHFNCIALNTFLTLKVVSVYYFSSY